VGADPAGLTNPAIRAGEAEEATMLFQLKGLTEKQTGYQQALDELAALIERIADEGRPGLAHQIHVEAWVPIAAQLHIGS
jgi:hypothetical protein